MSRLKWAKVHCVIATSLEARISSSWPTCMVKRRNSDSTMRRRNSECCGEWVVDRMKGENDGWDNVPITEYNSIDAAIQSMGMDGMDDDWPVNTLSAAWTSSIYKAPRFALISCLFAPPGFASSFPLRIAVLLAVKSKSTHNHPEGHPKYLLT